MTNEHNHLVIMAGGVGSRFWPMSTEECPKQFIDVLGCGRTLMQLTVDRFRGIINPENVWVVTNRNYEAIVRQQLPDLPAGNVLLEPCRRNTAPCIAYVSWRIKSVDPKANIVVTPSDHIVTDVIEFQRIINNALEFTSTSDGIVTLGMRPTRPETGYGYIQADLSDRVARNSEIYPVDHFREKPDLETAKSYIEQNNFFWNAGIFVWSVSTIINAFRVYQPVLNRQFEELAPYYGTPQEQEKVDEVFPLCESISIDYAVMEKADEIYCMPSDFGWSDLGTWGSLINHLPHDLYGNATVGENVRLFDSTGCIVHTTEEKKVIIQGLHDYIVAEKDNTLLICSLAEEQRIKQFQAE